MKKKTEKPAQVSPFEILLVEDSPSDVRLTQGSLKEEKFLHHLNVCEDGEEVMDFLKKRKKYTKAPTPDLILLDLKLPKKSGQEVLEEIKKDARLKRIPVVILTASKAEEDILKSYDLHCNAYITKPVDLKGFLEVAKRIKDFWFTLVKLPTQIGAN